MSPKGAVRKYCNVQRGADDLDQGMSGGTDDMWSDSDIFYRKRQICDGLDEGMRKRKKKGLKDKCKILGLRTQKWDLQLT